MTTTNDAIAKLELRPPTSREAVLSNCDAILGLVAEDAVAGDSGDRLPEPVARAFRAAGLFEMGFPQRRGGIEMSLVDQVTVVAKIARIDAAAAWNVGVLNATGYYAGRLGEAAYRELYPIRDMPTCGAFHPRGRAEVTDGGYLVSGHWDWGSGSYIAEHIVGGALVFDGDAPVIGRSGEQLVLGLWLPREAIVHADNWQVLGVRASGSSSFAIEEPVFIPAGHSFDREPPADAGADPLNKHVRLAFFGLTGVCMGLAQHAVELALAQTRRFVRPGGRGPATIVRALGQACSEVDLMVAGIMEIARGTDEIVFTPGAALTRTQELRLTATNTMAAETLRRVLDLCTEIYGPHYIFDSDPMQRVVRDAWAALAHAGARRNHWSPLADAIVSDLDSSPTLLPEKLLWAGAANVA